MKLNLGCRNKPLPTYVNLDIDPNNKLADLIDDALELKKIKDNSCDLIEAVHMAEHLSQKDFKKAITLWYNKLKEGGILRLSVPDSEKCAALLLLTKDQDLVKAMFMGSQLNEWDFHRSLHTKDSVIHALQYAGGIGFRDIREWNYWDTFPHNYCDSYAAAVWPPMRKKFKLDNGKLVDLGGIQLSLNIEATK